MPNIILPENDPLTSSVGGVNEDRVDTVHPEVSIMLDRWTKIRDCIAGEQSVKGAKTRYLPQPNATDLSDENQARYSAYIDRAQFYMATQRTLSGLVGQVFAVDPTVELPQSMRFMVEDLDGNGVSIEASLQQAVASVVAYGRAGLFIDYPRTQGVVSVAERDQGLIRPNIILYSPFSIINYRTRKVGAIMKKSLIVLAETQADETSEFEVNTTERWRVLALDTQDQYFVRVYERKPSADSSLGEGMIELVDTYQPLDAKGQPFTDIPFEFLGSLNNNQHPDNPPLEGIATLNIGHYRNSADYEEAAFMVGQPTVWAAGLDRQWIQEVFKDQTLHIGSRAIVPLPKDASMGILQAQANSMPLEAMALKEKQMAALGAKLVEPAQVQRTLGEARLHEATSSSILVTCVKNVQAAYLKAFEFAKQFHGEGGSITLQISTDFAISRLDPNERQVMFNEWVGGGITTHEYRTQLRKAGIATDPDNSPEIKRPEPTQTNTVRTTNNA